MTIENGTVDIFDPLRSPAEHALAAGHQPDADAPTPVAGRRRRRPRADFRRRRQRPRSTGRCGDPPAATTSATWLLKGVDPRRPSILALTASIEGLEISPELRASAARRCGERNSAPLGGCARAREAELPRRLRPGGRDVPWHTQRRRPRFVHGRIDDPRLPHPLTDIHAVVRLDNQGLRGRGPRPDEATRRRSACRPAAIVGREKPPLTAGRRKSGNWSSISSWSPCCRKTSGSSGSSTAPDGQIDADAKLLIRRAAWRPAFDVRMPNVSFTHHKVSLSSGTTAGDRLAEGRRVAAPTDGLQRKPTVRIWTASCNRPLSDPIGLDRHQGRRSAAGREAFRRPARAVPRRRPARSISAGRSASQDHLWRQSRKEPPHQQLVRST